MFTQPLICSILPYPAIAAVLFCAENGVEDSTHFRWLQNAMCADAFAHVDLPGVLCSITGQFYNPVVLAWMESRFELFSFFKCVGTVC